MTTDRALDILAMSEQARWKDGIEPEDVKKAVETIRKALPTVTPERPKGKWLTPYGSYSYRLTTYKCSRCECETDNNSNYCPYCGEYKRE